MRISENILLLSLLIFISGVVQAQDILKGHQHLLTPVKQYSVYQTSSKITIDGIGDEEDWQLAKWNSDFENLKGEEGDKPKYLTRFKILWEDQTLYFLVELEEPHIWTYYTTHDQFVYLENAFAFLIDPERSTHNYYGFYINAQNTRNDFYHTKPPRNGGRERIDWSPWGIKNAVSVHGTLNNPADKDEKWVLEVAVPFKDLAWNGRYITPTDGQFWKMNFLRIQWPTQINNGRYQKRNVPHSSRIKNGDSYYLYADNWVWSPQGIANMFYPERWGLVRFIKRPVGEVNEDFALPKEETLGKYLWAVYYKQQHHRRQKGFYAATLSEFGIPQIVSTDTGEKVLIKQEVRGSYLTLTLQTKSRIRFTINQDGLFQIHK